jgi:hypothetical protein
MARRHLTRSLTSAVLALAACGEGEAACPGGRCPGATRDLVDAALAPVSADEACAMQSTRARRGVDKQVDVIFIVDNSGSMTQEIEAIRANINRSFASIIADSGADFRVILLSLYGTGGTSLCIDPPLAGSACGSGIVGTQSQVLYHYDVEIDSVGGWCTLLKTFDAPDAAGLAPDGWGAWLRPEAEKAFVIITDDSPSCSYQRGEERVSFGGSGADPFADALAFHETLLALSPEQFGVPPNIRYAFHSIVGMAPRDVPTEPWFPHQEIENEICDTGASPGAGYQALSIITDALRYPVCEGRGFDAVFQVLARNVIERAKADCVFEIPEAPPEQGVDLLTVTVEYHPAGGDELVRFDQVASRDDCRRDAFYIADDRIRLCTDACDVVEADDAAELDVLYACTLKPQ